jgi:hypothetical protein
MDMKRTETNNQIELGDGRIVSVEIVTPEMCRRWREGTHKSNGAKRNRTIKKWKVKQMVAAKRAGKWDHHVLSSITIGMAGEEEFYADGQNRGQAIEDSGIPCMHVVIRDCEIKSAAMHPFDTGTGRSIADLLMEDHKVAAAVKLAVVMSRKVTRQQVEVYETEPWLPVVGEAVRELCSGVKGGPSGLNTVSVRLAFAIKYLECENDDDREHITETYRLFMKKGTYISDGFAKLKQQLKGDIDADRGFRGWSHQLRVVWRTLYALDNPDADTIQLPRNYYEREIDADGQRILKKENSAQYKMKKGIEGRLRSVMRLRQMPMDI